MPNLLLQYNQRFQKIFNSLNLAQQRAVEQIEGPVMVIAGPGTGKTHILASRIGYIRLKTDAHSSNILCLTFTEAGANAMRQRLLHFIGPEAHKVHIFTFHGFCNQVIRNHPDLFGSADIEPLNDLERIHIVRALIENLPADSPLVNWNEPYYYEPHLTNLFKIIKTEGWSKEDIHQAIDLYIAALPSNPAYIYQTGKQKGQLKEQALALERQRMEKLRSAAMLFDDYQAALKAKKRYDFDDMVLWVIDAFAKNEYLLRNYQEQYLYFLVDEYQDTNGAQNKVLQQLITYWELPNIFIVGDDDQAIYEFQGARLQSLKDLYQTYEKEIDVVVLKENYRSSQTILDSARLLIERNENRIINELKTLGVDKNLVAANAKLKKSKAKPQIVEYPSLLHEYVDITTQIENLMLDGESPDEIAIIYAKNKQAHLMMQLMDKKRIPYTTKRPINVLKERIIQQVILLLKYLEAEKTQTFSGEAFLFQILHFQCWQLSSREIAQLALFLQQQNIEKELPLFWRQAIADSLLLRQANVSEIEGFQRASELIENLLEQVNRIPLAQLYERVLNTTGILSAIASSADALNQIQMLHTFFSFLQKEIEKNDAFELSELINMLSLMDIHRLSLPMQKNISASKGVMLTTAHSAKGLEFKYVFIIDATQDAWDEDGKNNRTNFKLPHTLTLTQTEDSGIEARRRLFYVAMTRAKQSLQISYSLEEKRNRSVFIEELLEKAQLSLLQKQLNLQTAIDAGVLLFETGNVSLDNQNQAFIQERLEGFVLSPSSLNRYLDCPLSFYYEHLLKVPVVPSEALAYGNAVHNALEKTARQHKKTGFLPTCDTLIGYFEQEMWKQKAAFSADFFQQRLQNGINRLRAYYDKIIIHWTKNVEIELHLRQTTIDEIPVQGVIDRVEFLADGTVSITDFKTGKYKSSHVSELNEKNSEGGSYRRQLLFYKLLYENHIQGNRPVSNAQLSYLEPDALGEFPLKAYQFGATEIQQFKALLHQVYERIMQQDFYEGCGKERCHWCNFKQKHLMPLSFSNTEIEGLDDNI
jgi:DNA helicase II / ATP-dependent DNA helicase PcrA